MNMDGSSANLSSSSFVHGDPHVDAVKLFLTRRPEELRNAFAAAAIPHWFDERILGQMLGVDGAQAKSMVEQLNRLSFVDRFPSRSGWRVHESVRQPFREDLFLRASDEFVRLSRHAMTAFNPEGSAVDRIEHLFHWVCAAPDLGSRDLRRRVRWVVERGRSHETHFLVRVLEEIAEWGDRWPELPARVWLSLASAKFGSASSTDLQSWADEVFQRLRANADRVDRADAHELLGRVYRLRNQSAEALAEFRQAAEILDRSTEEMDAEEVRRDFANLQIEIGRSMLSLGMTEGALGAFAASRDILKALAGRRPERTPTDWRFGLAVAYNGIGEVCLKLGKTGESLDAISAYRSIMADLAKDDPENSHWQRDLAVATFCEGELQRVRGQNDEALASFEAAAQLLEVLATTDPTNVQWLRDLSEARNGAGLVKFARRDFPGASGDFLAARSIRERLLAQDPGNAEWKRDLGSIHNNLGRVFEAQGRLAEAHAEYQSDLETMKEMVGGALDNAETQRDLSVSHLNIGRVHRALGRIEMAEASVREAMKIRAGLVQLDPLNAEWQRDYAVAEKDFGECLEALGRRAEAVAAFSRAQTILTSLMASGSGGSRWIKDLERVNARLAGLGTSETAGATD